MKVMGRFHRGPLKAFLQKMAEIAEESRKPTTAERILRKIAYSLDNDFREGFRPRPHGHDAHSIAEREYHAVEKQRVAELVEAEVCQLRAQAEAFRVALMATEARLAELDHSRGSSEYHKRQAEIAAARARNQEHAA